LDQGEEMLQQSKREASVFLQDRKENRSQDGQRDDEATEANDEKQRRGSYCNCSQDTDEAEDGNLEGATKNGSAETRGEDTLTRFGSTVRKL
jgi:hypothetical protein